MRLLPSKSITNVSVSYEGDEYELYKNLNKLFVCHTRHT